MKLDDIKTIIVEWAESKLRIDKIYLFGSRIKGDYREESDLDVAVVLNHVESHEVGNAANESSGIETCSEREAYFICNKSDWLKELQEKFDLKIDLQILTEETPKVKKAIDDASWLIYERENPRTTKW